MNEITYIAKVIMDFVDCGAVLHYFIPFVDLDLQNTITEKSIKYINNTTNKGSTASAHSLVQLIPFMAQIHDVIALKWIKHKLTAKMFVPTPQKTPGRGSFPETPDRY